MESSESSADEEELPSEEEEGTPQQKDAVVVDASLSDMDYLRARMSKQAFAEEEPEEADGAESAGEGAGEEEAAESGRSVCIGDSLVRRRLHAGAASLAACGNRAHAAICPVAALLKTHSVWAKAGEEGPSDDDAMDVERRLSHGRAAPSSAPGEGADTSPAPSCLRSGFPVSTPQTALEGIPDATSA